MADNMEGAISASKIRGGLAELESKSAQVLQSMENMTVTSGGDDPQDPATSPDNYPGLLAGEKKESAEIIGALADLISHSGQTANSAESVHEGEYLFPPLDEVSQMALISHSMAAYLHHLRRGQLRTLTSKIFNDTNRWLSHIFRFVDGVSTYHHDNTETVVRALRLAIMARGQTSGGSSSSSTSLSNASLYVCEESAMLSLQFACKQLGLSLDCIRMVPQNTSNSAGGGTIGTMDVSVLQKLILADVANQRQPLLVIASAGTPIMGSVDNVTRIYDICRAHSIWLHCRGHCLAALATCMGPGDIKTMCDSMSLAIGSWLGIPSLPVVLLHRPIPNVAFTDLESDPVISRRLSSLPLWTSLQALGREAISGRILMAFEACRVVQDIVSKCYGVRILSKQPITGRNNSIVDLLNEPLNPTLLFETAQSVVVFQFDSASVLKSAETDSATLSQSSDRMNVWLGEILQRECPEIDLEILDHPIYGTLIRFCPLELGMGVTVPTVDSVRAFAECLHGQVEILVATEHHKVTFRKLLEDHRVLRNVELPEWAGLGGVRYVPDGWDQQLLSEEMKTELNNLNVELVEQLRATDSAFALGEGADGFMCVKFGMVTIETDVQELLQLVITCGQKVQENSRMLDSMAEIVKKGIETVTADLQRESDEKLWQEGILRHVPVVGRMVNWWSPVAKEAGIKGRSLNLTHGIVESTENIYRYHMQLTGATGTTPGNKSPPPPMVQQSVGSAGHSRNVSQGSANSSNQTGAQQQQQQQQQQQLQQQTRPLEERPESTVEVVSSATAINSKEGGEMTTPTAAVVEEVGGVVTQVIAVDDKPQTKIP